MSETKVLRCYCSSGYQDTRYGPGFRLHNRCKPVQDIRTWRCTVCQAERTDAPGKGSRK